MASTPAGTVSDEGAVERAPRVAPPLVWGVAAAVLGLDQLTKAWAQRALDDRTIELVWTLRFRLVANRGSAFGLGSRYAPLIALVAVAVVLVLLATSRSVVVRPAQLGIGLVVGGALGNVVDRVFREGEGFLGGAVVDFIDLQWWPVFNVADSAICVGAALLVLFVGRR